MPASRPEFDDRMARLKSELDQQARSVQAAIELALDGAFDKDASKARHALELESRIDREDIRIERAAVAVLHEATTQGVRLDEPDVRMVLTIVKVNNELERIADSAATIAERLPDMTAIGSALPPKFRVMSNSVIGIMQTTCTALAHMDLTAAQVVLASDDATEAFKQAILGDTMRQLAAGQHTVEYAMALASIASNLGRMADHCTNIAEQVIYVVTGKVVRHEGDKWTKPEEVA
ncbi:MAG: hypothetical protein JNK58_10840 [Phycisphaerae bacterium]|nr:hypothetical protein [Phycisphaerae bacterium]